jgi:hypothetical protein
MDEWKFWLRSKTSERFRQGPLPWWVWALVLVGGLAVLVGWLVRRRTLQPQMVMLIERITPRLRVPETPLENIPPVIQDIPLPVQRTTE